MQPGMMGGSYSRVVPSISPLLSLEGGASLLSEVRGNSGNWGTATPVCVTVHIDLAAGPP